MKKYKPANLQSVKEFIQRMLDGEVFYGECNENKYYFTGGRFCKVDSDGQERQFVPANIGGREPLLTEGTPTIQDAIAEKPRLCWVWGNEKANLKNSLTIIDKYNAHVPHPFISLEDGGYKHAELATLEEIKQYLGD